MKTITIDLVAGVRKNIYVLGDFFHLLETSAALDIEFISGGNVVDTAYQMEFGFNAKPEGGFTELGFTSATNQTIKIMVGQGDAGYDRLTGTVQIIAQQGSVTQTGKSVTNANQQLLPANTSRKYMFIQNNSAASVLRVKLDGNAATATEGIRIQPGGWFEMPVRLTSLAVNAIMETADATANNVELIEG